jgi:hypothetical protein
MGERSSRAALRFLDELDRLVDRIAAGAEAFRVFDGDLRRALFRRFPFCIVFWVMAPRWSSSRLPTESGDPGFWRGRV